jgi:DNA processing protein
MKNNIEILAMSLIKGMGPKSITEIVKFMQKNNFKSVLDIDSDLLLSNVASRYSSIIVNELKSNHFMEYLDHAENQLESLSHNNIDFITFTDTRYPAILKLADNHPVFLYCKGNINLLSQWNNVAVVGTRENTELGEKITRKSVDFLCSHDYTIVSGLALGIDCIAHHQALENNGKTIAVLVDVKNIQPASNRDLANNILDKDGLWIAENAPGTRIVPGQFVSRDRIQSGLSAAVFAIETSIDGGTMHAVRNCLKENRLLFCPDLERLAYPECKQIEGIKELLVQQKAIPYSKDSYNEVAVRIEQMISQLQEPQKQEQSSLFD